MRFSIDVYSRYVVGWSVSNTMTAQWCVDTIAQVIAKHGKPEVNLGKLFPDFIPKKNQKNLTQIINQKQL